MTSGGVPEERTPEFYARRPCLRLAGEAAAILDRLLLDLNNENREDIP